MASSRSMASYIKLGSSWRVHINQRSESVAIRRDELELSPLKRPWRYVSKRGVLSLMTVMWHGPEKLQLTTKLGDARQWIDSHVKVGDHCRITITHDEESDEFSGRKQRPEPELIPPYNPLSIPSWRQISPMTLLEDFLKEFQWSIDMAPGILNSEPSFTEVDYFYRFDLRSFRDAVGLAIEKLKCSQRPSEEEPETAISAHQVTENECETETSLVPVEEKADDYDIPYRGFFPELAARAKRVWSSFWGR